VTSNASFGVAFTGLSNVEAAISGYAVDATWCCPQLVGERYLSLGGGNGAGEFTADTIKAVTNHMWRVLEANYTGVVFDAEIISGPAEELIPLFAACFRQAKAVGLKVMVTMSHSAPYHTDTPMDAVAFVKAWVRDGNIDMVSPQLYTSGHEDRPDFDETFFCKESGCTWLAYMDSVPMVVPSIVNASHYPEVEKFFAGALSLGGYVTWAQGKA
jgi:hypothetical protein